MKLNALSLVGALLVGALLGVGGAKLAQPEPQKPLGATPGTEITSETWTVNGVTTHFASQAINRASTTLCSLKAPTASSTLVYASVNFNTGTTTDIQVDMAANALSSGASSSATSSKVMNTNTLTAGTVGGFNASTTALLAQAGTNWKFSPAGGGNKFLLVKYGGSGGTYLPSADKSNDNSFTGSCKAEWVLD